MNEGIPAGLPDDINVSYKPEHLAILSSLQGGAESPPQLDLLDQLESSQYLVEWAVHEQGEPDPSNHEEVPKQYLLSEVIGQGGFAEIWKATQTSLGRLIAVKRMRKDLFDQSGQNPSTIKHIEISFRQEAMTAAMLDHPNIVPVHDIGLDSKGRTLLAMKLVRGKSWEVALEEDWNRLSESEYYSKHLPILAQTAQAVSFAHSRGVVHRDLKPSQVMIGQFGEVTLMDWGLAVIYDKEKTLVDGAEKKLRALASTIESAVNPAGTIAFMAPEQTEETASNIGPWTDIYLLGGTLYYLLTGTVPHRAPGNVIAFYKASQGIVEPPQKRASKRDIPDELAALCMEALNPNRNNRIPSASEFVARVEGYLRGANKQKESRELTSRASESLLSSGTNYEEYGRAMALMERAAALWPKNPVLEELTNEIASRFATLALKNHDLRLAAMQINRMNDCEARSSLLKKLKTAEQESLENAILRRRLKVASVAFCTLLAAMIILYIAYQARKKAVLTEINAELRAAFVEAEAARRKAIASAAIADEARNAANKERIRSEELVHFLVSDLTTELGLLGRINIMSKMTDKLSAYYKQRPADMKLTDVDAQNEGLALRTMALVQYSQGHSEESRRSLDHSMTLFNDLLAKSPDNLTYQFQVGRCHDALGKLARVEGEFDSAVQHFTKAAAIFQSLHEKHPDDLSYAAAYCEAIHGLSAIYCDIGDNKRASDASTTGREIFEKLLAENPTRTDLVVRLSPIYDVCAQAAWRSNNMDLAMEHQEKVLALLQRFAQKEPWNLQLQRLIGWNERLTGDLLVEEKRLTEGERSYNAAMDVMLRLEGYDPESIPRKLDAAGLLNALANFYRETNSADIAMDRLDRAKVTIEAVLQSDATNVTAKMELAHNYLVRGRVLAATGDVESAHACWEQSLKIMQSTQQNLKTSQSLYLSVGARALLLLGKNDEAMPVLKELEARHYRSRFLYEIGEQAGALRKDPTIPYLIELAR
ncbi:MAG TPA: protein kinase [Candidatus Sumerlaeota bacterium]|nr:protein kinase [Candidatus Sumerlaeota bacterium]